jgi:glycosyltransferase involved in cell wall biosynthesis
LNELISVAIATYNGEKFINEQLDSIYNQTYKNIEIIVVDDCSTDNTLNILNEYNKNFGLKYYKNKNRLGVTKNFEKAISLCSGNLIALCDQDDVWLPSKLQDLYENIGNYSLIYSNCEIIDDKSSSLNLNAKNIYPLYGLDSNDKDSFYKIVLNGILLGSACLFKREIFSIFFPVYDSSRNHDWWLQVCAFSINGIKYFDKILFKYRHHDNNVSRKNKISFSKSILRFFKPDQKKFRKQKNIESQKIVSYLLNKNFFNLEYQLLFLNDLQNMYGLLNQPFFPIKFFLISFKYRKQFFNHNSKIKNYFNLFSRLFN